LSMIFSENRYPLFGSCSVAHARSCRSAAAGGAQRQSRQCSATGGQRHPPNNSGEAFRDCVFDALGGAPSRFNAPGGALPLTSTRLAARPPLMLYFDATVQSSITDSARRLPIFAGSDKPVWARQ
jgi:hypothetical protein